MTYRYSITAAALAFACLAAPGPADAQRRTAQPAPDSALPLCREAAAGERCRTRNGTVRIRRGARPGTGATDAPGTSNLGGGDPGWGVRGERVTAEEPVSDAASRRNNFGGEDPGWVRQPDGGNEFGGDDPGWVQAPDGRLARPVGGGDVPAPEAMECEFCDDDEDEPQGPIDNTPRPQSPAPSEPEEEEDCEWRNPAGGPDQEFCDE